ncbi:MAG: epoxyqueuosine reductase QueH [Clostridia bacterium]|nr:epoxyqueuosine reductase QueH [Clostridia bacterium]
MSKKRLLLHSCCGPCSTACIERLVDDFDITVFYYNPCINDQEEYEKRKDNQIKFINEYNEKLSHEKGKILFVEGKYDPENFISLTGGYEEEPEGGARCGICFRQRLNEAGRYASENGFDCFTTTLTVSPHKNYDLISAIGQEVAENYNCEYMAFNFKKKDGFKRSTELSKEYGLYRQDYCGCEYSKRV